MQKIASTILDKKNNIVIDNGTALKLTIEGFDAFFNSIFVGAKVDEYIVITPPFPSLSAATQLPKGSQIEVKYFRESESFLFRSQFIQNISTPIELMVLAFPDAVQSGELRSSKRINCFISARVEWNTGDNGKTIHGVIKDISKTGCRLQFNVMENQRNLFVVGEKIILKCNFPGIVGEQSALGHIIDVLKLNGGLIVGIQFSTQLWWVPPYE